MGIVEEVGSGVTLLEKGDRIVMPFNVADGRCRNCEEGKTAFCTGVNPGFAGGAYGYVVSYIWLKYYVAPGFPRGQEESAHFHVGNLLTVLTIRPWGLTEEAKRRSSHTLCGF